MLTHEPIGFEGTIVWEDSPDGQEYLYISFGEYDDENDAECDSFGINDESIFFYADTEQYEVLQKAIAEHRDCVTIEPHSGWYIDLAEPYEFVYG